MIGLDSLSAVVAKDYSKEPTDEESVFFLFLDLGVDFNSFCQLPLPYIFSIIKVKNYLNKLHKKEMDRIK